MARELRGKKMPAKPMKQMEADDELALDMPMSDEEAGSEEADADMLPLDESAEGEPSQLDQFSDDELLAEMEKRGLSMEDAQAASEEPSSEEPISPEEY